MVRRVLLEWEKLRIGYNVVLAVLVVLQFAATPGDFTAEPWRFAWTLAVGAFMANVLFCAGPVVDLYVSLLAGRPTVMRWVLFWPGLIFASLLTWLVMITFAWADNPF